MVRDQGAIGGTGADSLVDGGSSTDISCSFNLFLRSRLCLDPGDLRSGVVLVGTWPLRHPGMTEEFGSLRKLHGN